MTTGRGRGARRGRRGGALLVARRRHWAEAVRRHTVAASAAGIAALVVLAPVAWYLVSPVFIRTSRGAAARGRRAVCHGRERVARRERHPSDKAVRIGRARGVARGPDAHPVESRPATLRARSPAPTTSTSGAGRRRSTRPRPASGRSDSTTSASGTGRTCTSTSRPPGRIRRRRDRGRELKATDGSFNVRPRRRGRPAGARSVLDLVQAVLAPVRVRHARVVAGRRDPAVAPIIGSVPRPVQTAPHVPPWSDE